MKKQAYRLTPRSEILRVHFQGLPDWLEMLTSEPKITVDKLIIVIIVVVIISLFSAINVKINYTQ